MSDTLSSATPAPEVLEVRGLHVEIAQGFHKLVHAVSGIDFSIHRKETLGLVGESGCGKTTTGKAIAGLIKPTQGDIIISGTKVTGLPAKESRKLRRKVQFIFQDPISSLNPRRKIINTVMEPSSIWSIGTPDEQRKHATNLLEQVGLDPRLISDRMPYQLSGGQCQRVSIARALMLSPELLICDEPVSALDVSVQATILNLLNDIQEQYQLSMLFISHDLAVVRSISDRIAVMYMGRLCETASTVDLFNHAMHPYTHELLSSAASSSIYLSSTGTYRSLLKDCNTINIDDTPSNVGKQNDDLPIMTDHDEDSAIPDTDKKLIEQVQLHEVPSALKPPSGCRFHTRCPYADDICVSTQPEMRRHPVDTSEKCSAHLVACHHPLNI